MKRLIINADDLGMNAQRTHGIFQCMEFGVVSNATLVANTADASDAARRARERALPVGLHLNLTEEYPVSLPEQVGSLLQSGGGFLDREQFTRALAEEQIDREHLAREIRAQLEWFFDSVGSPTHVDSHHHVHIHRTVANTLTPLLERYGVRFVRIPCEEPLPPYGYEVGEALLERTRLLNERAMVARDLYGAAGIGSTEHFRGLTLVGNASLKNLRHVLSRLPEGTTELMVHPGSLCSYGTPFDLDPQRQTELRMLTDPSIPVLLAEKKIELSSYGDL